MSDCGISITLSCQNVIGIGIEQHHAQKSDIILHTNLRKILGSMICVNPLDSKKELISLYPDGAKRKPFTAASATKRIFDMLAKKYKLKRTGFIEEGREGEVTFLGRKIFRTKEKRMP